MVPLYRDIVYIEIFIRSGLSNLVLYLCSEEVNKVSTVPRDRRQCEKKLKAILAKYRADDREISKSRHKTGGGNPDTDEDSQVTEEEIEMKIELKDDKLYTKEMEEEELRELAHIYMGVDAVYGICEKVFLYGYYSMYGFESPYILFINYLRSINNKTVYNIRSLYIVNFTGVPGGVECTLSTEDSDTFEVKRLADRRTLLGELCVWSQC